MPAFCLYQGAKDRDREVECTQCTSTLGILSIARLFAEWERFCAVCHFQAAHLQRNYLSILLVCSRALWYGGAASSYLGWKLLDIQTMCVLGKGARKHKGKKKRSDLCVLHCQPGSRAQRVQQPSILNSQVKSLRRRLGDAR